MIPFIMGLLSFLCIELRFKPSYFLTFHTVIRQLILSIFESDKGRFSYPSLPLSLVFTVW